MVSPSEFKHQFTINLLSNASMEVFPDNTLSLFRTILPLQNGLLLEGNWEVALSEIVYPVLVKNINDHGNFRFRSYIGDKEEDPPYYQARVTAGLYNDMETVVSNMETCVASSFARRRDYEFVYTIDPFTKLMSMTLPNESSFLGIQGSELARVTGFKQGRSMYGQGPHIAAYPVNFQPVDTLLIYTDIIQHQIVGDIRAPLLRAVPFTWSANTSPSKTVAHTFQHLEFKRLSQNVIHTILIDLRSERGNRVSFLDVGHVSLTLFFRPIGEA